MNKFTCYLPQQPLHKSIMDAMKRIFLMPQEWHECYLNIFILHLQCNFIYTLVCKDLKPANRFKFVITAISLNPLNIFLGAVSVS